MENIDKNSFIRVMKPQNALPVVFDSPHSGRNYPDEFHYDCDFQSLTKLEDRDVDDLFSAAPDHKAILLCADFPRSYIDVNRARDDIDPELICKNSDLSILGTLNPTERSDSGLGLISRLIRAGMPIYQNPIKAQEIHHRITQFYDPYHAALKQVLDESYYNYGSFWHINCHSMPSVSAYPRKNILMTGTKPVPCDIVLGDRDGQTCNRDFMYALRDFWKSQGMKVTLNDPFKGVELIQRHAQPTRGKNSVQIEINRALYLNEETGERIKSYNSLKSLIEQMIALSCSFAASKLTRIAAD